MRPQGLPSLPCKCNPSPSDESMWLLQKPGNNILQSENVIWDTPKAGLSSNLEKFLSISISRVYSLISHCVAVLTVRSLREHMLRHLTDSGTVSLVKAGGCFSNSQFASVISNVNQSFGFKRLDKI